MDEEAHVVAPIGAATHEEAAAVDPHRDGQLSVPGHAGRADDVDVQAVLRLLVANLVTPVAVAVQWVLGSWPAALPGGVEALRDSETRRHLDILSALLMI